MNDFPEQILEHREVFGLHFLSASPCGYRQILPSDGAQ